MTASKAAYRHIAHVQTHYAFERRDKSHCMLVGDYFVRPLVVCRRRHSLHCNADAKASLKSYMMSMSHPAALAAYKTHDAA